MTALTRRRVIGRIRFWERVFRFDPFYTIAVKLNMVPDSKLPDDLREDTEAQIDIDGSYGEVSLFVNVYKLKTLKDLDRVITHEFGHVLLHDLRRLAEEATANKLNENVLSLIERTNEKFSRVIVAAHHATRSRK